MLRTAARPARTPSKAEDYVIRFTTKERDFVYGVAMRYMKDEEEAADVTQEALLLAWRHRGSFQGNSRFTTWLYRVAATTALMALRKRRRTPLMVSTDADPEDETPRDEPRDLSATPEDASASTEALGIAAHALDEMGDKYGRIFTLRFLDGMSEAEIARLLDLNVSTVKTRAYRARAYLRRHLAAAFGETDADAAEAALLPELDETAAPMRRSSPMAALAA